MDNDMEDGAAGGLPTKQDEEFRPFIRRLPEFKFWHSATRAITIAFTCTWFEFFDIPVFWPVLVVYWLILFTLTSKSYSHRCKDCIKRADIVGNSAETNSTHDQVSLRAVLIWQDEIYQKQLVRLGYRHYMRCNEWMVFWGGLQIRAIMVLQSHVQKLYLHRCSLGRNRSEMGSSKNLYRS